MVNDNVNQLFQQLHVVSALPTTAAATAAAAAAAASASSLLLGQERYESVTTTTEHFEKSLQQLSHANLTFTNVSFPSRTHNNLRFSSLPFSLTTAAAAYDDDAAGKFDDVALTIGFICLNVITIVSSIHE